MFKIGEFSKLSMLTVKALRFYEKEGLLSPAHVDEWSGYRSTKPVNWEQRRPSKLCGNWISVWRKSGRI